MASKFRRQHHRGLTRLRNVSRALKLQRRSTKHCRRAEKVLAPIAATRPCGDLTSAEPAPKGPSAHVAASAVGAASAIGPAVATPSDHVDIACTKPVARWPSATSGALAAIKGSATTLVGGDECEVTHSQPVADESSGAPPAVAKVPKEGGAAIAAKSDDNTLFAPQVVPTVAVTNLSSAEAAATPPAQAGLEVTFAPIVQHSVSQARRGPRNCLSVLQAQSRPSASVQPETSSNHKEQEQEEHFARTASVASRNSLSSALSSRVSETSGRCSESSGERNLKRRIGSGKLRAWPDGESAGDKLVRAAPPRPRPHPPPSPPLPARVRSARSQQCQVSGDTVRSKSRTPLARKHKFAVDGMNFAVDGMNVLSHGTDGSRDGGLEWSKLSSAVKYLEGKGKVAVFLTKKRGLDKDSPELREFASCEIVWCPANKDGDLFLLQYAHDHDYTNVVTNDGFQNHTKTHGLTEEWRARRIVGYTFCGHEFTPAWQSGFL